MPKCSKQHFGHSINMDEIYIRMNSENASSHLPFLYTSPEVELLKIHL